MQVAVPLICHFMEIVYASLSLMNAFIYPLEKKNVLPQMWNIKK